MYTEEMQEMDKHVKDSTFTELYTPKLRKIVSQIVTSYILSGVPYMVRTTFNFAKDTPVMEVWSTESEQKLVEYNSILEVLVFFADAFKNSTNPLATYYKSISEHDISIGSIQPKNATELVFTKESAQELALRRDITAILLGGGYFILDGEVYKYDTKSTEPREAHRVYTGPLGYLADVIYGRIRTDKAAIAKVKEYADSLHSLLEPEHIERKI